MVNLDYLPKLMMTFVKKSECKVQCRCIFFHLGSLAIYRLLSESKQLETEAKFDIPGGLHL